MITMKILDDALRNQDECQNKTGWKQDPKRRAGCVHPKIPDGLRIDSRDAANERNSKGNANGGRYKVVVRQPNHLGEVTHRGFGNVSLPIGVRREADSRIPRERGRDACEPVRVQRQEVLGAFENIQKQ